MEGRAEIEPGSLRRLVQASRTWDKASRAQMRKGLRLAASVGAEAAKREVMGPPPGPGTAGRRSGRSWWIDAKGKKKARGLRAGLSAGVKVSIQTGRQSRSTGAVTGEGVRVATTDSRLPGDQSPMVKAYMARAFRHPVFGGPGWADQRGKNWFYGPLMAGREEYKRAVVAAIEAAARAVAND
jgi:hypothetical protein